MSMSEEGEEGVPVSKPGLFPEREEGGLVSETIQSKKREEGVPASHPSLSGDHDSQTKAKGSPQQERPVSPVPSYISMKSDWSMRPPISFDSGQDTTDQSELQKGPEISSDQFIQDQQTALESIMKDLEVDMTYFVKEELDRFKTILSSEYPECLDRLMEEEEDKKSPREGALKIALHFLKKKNHQKWADSLENRTCAAVCQHKLKRRLSSSECIAMEEFSFRNQAYTELHITEGGSGEVNTQHEVRKIETASRKPCRPETPIIISNIFEALPGVDKQIRTVLTRGLAGIGKTVSTQKFTLDWAKGTANQNILFTLPLSFRELNLLKMTEWKFMDLLYRFFVELKEVRASRFNKYKVLFIFDGLDECQLPLDFQNNEICNDVNKTTSVDVLLTNLIKGNLLPSAQIWITTRRAAANQIPPACVDMVTDMRGFTDPQKDEYFTQRFSGEENMVCRVISHIKTSRSLHIMCHIPVFCRITAEVLERLLTGEQRGELPTTLTEKYIHFLLFQSKQWNVKYHGKGETDSQWNTESRKTILCLAKLAFQQLKEDNLTFYESDLTKCGIDVRAASVRSGVFTQIFRDEFELNQSREKEFTFVHLSIQEFLAAVYVILSFFNDKQNVMEEPPSPSDQSLHSLHMVAVDKALQSENGQWDLFLRFLLGLSLETNQKLLQGLLTQTGNSSWSNEGTIKYIKSLLDENPDLSPERGFNLIGCLHELGDTYVMKRLLLSDCLRTRESCAAVVLTVKANFSHLIELDLTNNDLHDSGVKLLSEELSKNTCKLETLRLSGCLITEEGVGSVASAIRSNPSHLRELDLSYNHPGESGEKLLSALLEDPQCCLRTLKVDHGGEFRIKPGFKKYACDLTLDPNTAHRNLSLSEDNRKVIWRREGEQPYPDHPERFAVWRQVLCEEGLTGSRWYWEVEWKGTVSIGVTYGGIERKGEGNDSRLGHNKASWILDCKDDSYTVCHNQTKTVLNVRSSGSTRVGVYLDCPGGTLSFYRVSSDTLTLLHTFHSTLTEPLYPGFWVWGKDSSVSLCQR